MFVGLGAPILPASIFFAGKAQLMAESPLNSADKIKTPLLVAQGANDPRVNRREAEQIVIALRDRGFPVEYILAPDEGHGFARPINNLALFMASEKFFAQHLGGKYQEGGTAEEVARLKEITVDPKTVVLGFHRMSGCFIAHYCHPWILFRPSSKNVRSVPEVPRGSHLVCGLGFTTGKKGIFFGEESHPDANFFRVFPYDGLH
jgi:hypothetical protein